MKLKDPKTLREKYLSFSIFAKLVLLIFFAIGPIFIDFSSIKNQKTFDIIVGLNLIAWTLVAKNYVLNLRLSHFIDEICDFFGFAKSSNSIETQTNEFFQHIKRWGKASYSYRIQGDVSPSDLGSNLHKIVSLAYEELPVDFAKLALFDSESGKFAQTMMMGKPKVVMSYEERLSEEKEIAIEYKDRNGGIVYRYPLDFAGIRFGLLSVEPQREFTTSDHRVMQLLAAQGALLLVDAKFTNELLRMRKASEESTKLKTGFLATLSHEIRGPLGIILNGVELVKDGYCGDTTEDQDDTLSMVQKSGTHLLDLVNDVLDYAKVESGKVAVNTEEVSLHEVLEDISNIIRVQAVSKNHKVTLDKFDPSIGVKCDRRHLRQMLINIATNSVKYTPDGGHIRFSVARGSEGSVKIYVEDDGYGIPEEEKSKVFEIFDRVNKKEHMEEQGSGLGMPLTRSLAKVNKGEVGFDSIVGKGTTFWISLPYCSVVNEEEISKAKTKTQTFYKGLNVFMICGQDGANTIITKYLKQVGYNLALAKSIKDVSANLPNSKPEIILIDDEFDDISKKDLVKLVKSYDAHHDTPLVLLSSSIFVSDTEALLALGVDRCFTKPVELEELNKVLQNLATTKNPNSLRLVK